MTEEQADLSTIPSPGSREAKETGCTCPVMDNGHGRGIMCNPGRFWINEGCPLHDSEAWRMQDGQEGPARN